MAFLLVAGTAKSQTYSYDEVIAKAGKALQKVLPAHLIPATEIRTTPYYLALTPDEEWQLLEKGKKTRGKLQTVKVRYKFLLRHTSCAWYSNIEANIELELNSKLELNSYTGLEDIPDFVLKNLPCPLITPAEVVAIAAKNDVTLQEKNIRAYYNSKTKKFTYSENGVIMHQAEFNADSVKKVHIGRLRIDGESGEVLENTWLGGTKKDVR